MGQTRLWRVRSFSSQALVWSQSQHPGARMRLPGDLDVGPFLRKIQSAIDERMTVARNVGSEDPDLAVRDLACGASVFPRHSARRFALLEKAGLVDHEDRIVIRQMLDDIIAYDIAQGTRIPIHAAQDRLLTPWAGIASRLGAHPTGLALLISE